MKMKLTALMSGMILSSSALCFSATAADKMVIAHRARQRGLAISADTVADLVAEMALPLIGPAECPDYPQRIELAAARWLKA